MSAAGRILSMKLLAVLMVITTAALMFACGGDDATTTTSAVSTTGAAGGTTPTGGGTETTTAATTGQGTQTTQASSAGELPPVPPSVVGGNNSSPPQPGAEYSEKLPALEQAAKEDPEDLDALAELAVAYYQTQSFAKAEETYKKMIGIDDRAEFHNNLANVYRDWAKTDQAVTEYQAAIGLDPETALWYGNLAAMYMMNGDIEKAKEVAEEGIEKTAGEQRTQLQQLLESLS